MASTIWDTATEIKSTGEMLNNFLYVDGKSSIKGGIPGVRKEHTKEELEAMLESIRQDAWETYDNIAQEMGWRQ